MSRRTAAKVRGDSVVRIAQHRISVTLKEVVPQPIVGPLEASTVFVAVDLDH
jgi:hypothetical protein